MDRVHHLAIGGLHITLRCDDDRISCRFQGATRRFLTETPGPSDLEFRVRSMRESEPRGGELLFDSGAVWRMFRDTGGFRIECSSEIFGDEPYKVATIDDSFSRGEIALRTDVIGFGRSSRIPARRSAGGPSSRPRFGVDCTVAAWSSAMGVGGCSWDSRAREVHRRAVLGVAGHVSQRRPSSSLARPCRASPTTARWSTCPRPTARRTGGRGHPAGPVRNCAARRRTAAEQVRDQDFVERVFRGSTSKPMTSVRSAISPREKESSMVATL